MSEYPAITITLNEREIAFCHEYCIDGNGARSARDAGYSHKSARSMASQLLSRPEIQNYILEIKKKREVLCEKKGIDAIRELDKIGYSNICDYVKFSEAGVVFKDSSELTAEQQAAIKSVEMRPSEWGMNIKITLHDKVKALELLCNHHGVINTVVPVDTGNKTAVHFIIPAFKNDKGLVEIPADSYKVLESKMDKVSATSDTNSSQ